MKGIFTKSLIVFLGFFVNQLFSQQKISGKIMDDQNLDVGGVLVLNSTKNVRSVSDISGNFTIEADENDEPNDDVDVVISFA